MSDATRGIALMLSVLLWLPVAPGLMRGELAAERALLVYAGALALALAGAWLLTTLIRAYASGADEAEAAETAEDATPRRRAEDALT